MNYKNYEISVLNNGFFYCEEFEVKAETYAEITKLIDAEIRKSKIKFEKIPVYFNNWTELREGVITSFVGDGAWVTDKSGKRSKISLSNIYEFSKENIEKISEVQELKRQKNNLQGRISEISQTIKKFQKQN